MENFWCVIPWGHDFLSQLSVKTSQEIMTPWNADGVPWGYDFLCVLRSKIAQEIMTPWKSKRSLAGLGFGILALGRSLSDGWGAVLAFGWV